jgi:hypothetical protein
MGWFMNSIHAPIFIILTCPTIAAASGKDFFLQIEPICLMRHGPIVIDVTLTYTGEIPVVTRYDAWHGLTLGDSDSPAFETWGPCCIVRDASQGMSHRGYWTALKKGNTVRHRYFLHCFAFPSGFPNKEVEFVASACFECCAEKDFEFGARLVEVELKKKALLKASEPTAENLQKLQSRLIDDMMCSSEYPSPAIWHDGFNLLMNTKASFLCPVAIAMIDCHGSSGLGISTDYLQACADRTQTVNDLLVKELIEPRFLSATVFLHWKNSRIPAPSAAQIKQLIGSKNVWVRALTMASFPDQVDKQMKEAATADVLAPTPDAEFLKFVELLDNQRFAIREDATKKLIARGDRYEAMIPTSRKFVQSFEVQDRLDQIQRQIKGRSLPAEVRCSLATLEQLGTAEADNLLRLIADGPDELRATKLAKEMLEKKRTDAARGKKK